MTETPRQRFLRNHYENVRIMRAAAKREGERGNYEAQKEIDFIADQWDRIGNLAEDEEKGRTA